MAQRVKCLPTMWETQVQSPAQKDPPEKEMATHSSTLALKIPWLEEPGGLQSIGSQRVGHDSATFFSFLSFGPTMMVQLSLGIMHLKASRKGPLALK